MLRPRLRTSLLQGPEVRRLVYAPVDQDGRSASNEHAESDAKEKEAGLGGCEGVWWAGENERESGKEKEEDCESESRVDGYGNHNWL
jgi:uncharacterized membrane protein